MVRKRTVEEETLKVAVSGGSVWCLDGVGLPCDTGLRPAQFLEAPLLLQGRLIRIVGSAANAGIIVALCGLRGSLLEDVEVCSPLVCESAEGRKDPELTLYNMRSFVLPPSLGGWRPVVGDDLTVYSLADHLAAEGSVTPYARLLAASHPVWAALTFVGGLNEDAAVRLVALIIDPRWYIDPDEPDRLSRLEQYLGLNPKTMRSVIGELKGSWLQDRCRLVTRVWREGFVKVPCGQSVGKSTSVGKACDDFLRNPHNFLWRIWEARGMGLKADLSASKQLVCYLRHNWLNEVAGEPKRGRLFVPGHFFTRPDEVAAYNDHMRMATRL